MCQGASTHVEVYIDMKFFKTGQSPSEVIFLHDGIFRLHKEQESHM